MTKPKRWFTCTPSASQLEAGTLVCPEDSALLYHATTSEGAAGTCADGYLTPNEDGAIYISPSPSICGLLLNSRVVVPLRIKLDDLGESKDALDEEPPFRRVDYTVITKSSAYVLVGMGRDAFR